MKKLFSFVLGVFMVTTLFSVALPAIAAGDYGLKATADAAGLTRSETPLQIIGQVIGAALSLVGIMFFILMIYAGINWMMARGDAEQTKTALRTIIAAVVGLIIILASYAITSFVFDSISGGSLAPTGTGGPVTSANTCGTTTATTGWSCKTVTTACGGALPAGVTTEAQIVSWCTDNPDKCARGMCQSDPSPTVLCCAS